MLDYRGWLGIGDEEDDDPVKKALGVLGQGASTVGQAVQDVGSGIGSAVSPYLPQPSATPSTQSMVGSPAPEDYSFAPADNPLAAGLAAAGKAGVEAYEETGGPLSPWSAPAMAPARAAYIAERALPEIGGEIGAAAGRAAAGPDAAPYFTVPESVPFYGGQDVGAEQVGRFVGGGLTDPLTYVGAAGAAAAGAPARRVAAELARGLPLVGESERAVRGAVGALRPAAGRVGEALGLSGNAERVAAADARMAAEGSTQLPGVLGNVPPEGPRGGGTPRDAGAVERHAVAEFGVTNEPENIGYLLRDGRGLDFSDGLPHPEIARVVGQEGDPIADFGRQTGAIRVRIQDGGLIAEAPTAVTAAQRRALAMMGRRAESAAIDLIDYEAGRHVSSHNFLLPEDRGAFSNFLAGLPDAAGGESPRASPGAPDSPGSTTTYGIFGAVPPERWGRPSEQALRSEVGKRYPDIRGDVHGTVRETLGEPSAEMLADSRYPRDAVHPDLRAAGIGPEITPQIDLSGRMNAGFGVVPEAPRRAPPVEPQPTPESLPPRPSADISPLGKRVMDTYTAVTPARVERSTTRATRITADQIASRIPARGGGLATSPEELVRQTHAAVVRNLASAKTVMTGIRPGAIAAYLRGEGLTSKVETRDLARINQITQGQVNVAGGRAGKPYTIAEAADFAQRESEQMRAATGGSRFPDPETGAVDEAAPRVLYGYVSEGQPLVGPNRPTAWLVWEDETPRITSAHHPYGLTSPGQDIHASMPPGLKAAIWSDDAVAGGRVAPAVMEGGRLTEAAQGGPGASPMVFDWQREGLDVGGGRRIADTNWLVGPEGEDAMRANGLLLGMPGVMQRAIARGDLTDPEDIAAALMRGGSPKWKSGWAAVMNPSRSESLIVDPSIEHVKAIYLTGSPKDLARRVPNSGGMTELQVAQRLRDDILAQHGKDVPILFTDISRAGAPTAIADARLLAGPATRVAEGRAGIVDRYTGVTNPATGEPYVDIGVSAGTLPAGPATDRLASVNRVLGQGIASSVSGGVGAQVNQEMNPDDPLAGIKGFAAGALVPPLAARGGMALARRAGRSADLGSAARIGLGDVPPSMIRTPELPGIEPPPPAPIGEAAEAMRLGPEQRTGASPVVQKVLSAADERARKMAERGEEPLSPLRWTAEALRNVTYSSLIGPATAVGNVIANVSEPLRALPKEAIRAVGRGEPREFTRMFTEGLYGLMGSKGEMLEAIKARGRYAANPDQPSLAERTINPVGHRFAQATEAGGRFFSGLPDAPFQALALRAGRARDAGQVATDLGLKGKEWDAYVDRLLADVRAVQGGELPTMPETQRVIDAGEAYGTRQTFRDELGEIGKKVEAASLNKVPVLGPLVSPFFKTPWNIAVRSAERSPAGFFMNSQGSRFDKAYDAIEGSGFLAAMILGPAAAGYITGSGPTDPEKRKMLQAKGWQPYSTYVPGAGVYIPNRYLGTYGTMFNLIGDAHDTLAHAKRDEGINGWLAEAAPKIGKNLRQQQYLTPLADILDMLDAPSPGAAIARYAGQAAAKAVPFAATARTIATALDPSQRELEGGAGVSFGERAGQAFEQQVGARSELPVAQDVLGRPVENPQQGAWALGPRMTTPRREPVVEAFEQARVDIGGPPSTLTTDEGQVGLTPAQRRRWNTARGQALRQAGAEIAGARALPPAERAAELRRVLAEASAVARSAVEPTITQQQRVQAERRKAAP